VWPICSLARRGSVLRLVATATVTEARFVHPRPNQWNEPAPGPPGLPAGLPSAGRRRRGQAQLQTGSTLAVGPVSRRTPVRGVSSAAAAATLSPSRADHPWRQLPATRQAAERITAKNHGNSTSRARMMITPTSLSGVPCSPPSSAGGLRPCLILVANSGAEPDQATNCRAANAAG
jgi:hypothetical protein